MDLSLYFLIFFSFNLHYARSFTTGHEVSGFIGDAFHVQTLLPVKYNTIVTDPGSFPIAETGNCSTDLFQCQISQDHIGQHLLTLKGTVSKDLTRIYLLSDENLVPTTIFFYIDNKWSDTTYGSINPTYSRPIVGRVPRNATVTLQCFINRWIPPFSLYTSINKTLYFSINSIGGIWENKTAEFPHILNIEHVYTGEGRLINITVTRNESVDYYTCNNGDYWLTNVIYWEDPVTTTTTTTSTTTTTTRASTTTSTTTTLPPEIVYTTRSTTVVNRGDRSATKPLVEDEIVGMNLGVITGITIGILCGILFIIICSLFVWRHSHKPTDVQPKDTESCKPESNEDTKTTTTAHPVN